MNRNIKYAIVVAIVGLLIYLKTKDENEVDAETVEPIVGAEVGAEKVNGYMSDWSDWSSCSRSCSGGLQTRSRTYNPAMNGGIDLSNEEKVKLLENRMCNPEPCSVDGYMSEWSNWSTCSKECGGGTQTRSRTYTPAQYGGADLSLDKYENSVSEIRSCNLAPCAVKHNKVLENGNKLTTTFTVFSPNNQYKLYWNGKYWFVVYTKNENGTWDIYSQMIINSKLNPIGFHAGRYDIYLTNEWSTKSLAYTDSEVLYSAITDNGEWVFIKKDGTAHPILKYNQKIEITW